MEVMSFKKNNAQDYLKGNIHTTAVNRLREKTKATSSQQIAATSSSRNQEKMIVDARILSKTEKAQLIINFSLFTFQLSGDRTYFSLLTDGSSSAKTMDEKELYVIKTCDKGKPRFDVLALEQPDDPGAKGLKENLIMQLRRQTYQLIGRLMKLDLALME